MSDVLCLVPLGSYALSAPLLCLRRRKLIDNVLTKAGFSKWPLALSVGASQQAARVAAREISIPNDLFDLCYDGEISEAVPNGQHLKTAKLTIVEISTPIEFVYDSFILSPHRVRSALVKALRHRDDETMKRIDAWLSAGNSGDYWGAREIAKNLAQLFGSELSPILVSVLREAYVYRACSNDVASKLQMIQHVLGTPIGVIIHNYRYMPDGHTTDWPVGFNDEVRDAVAQCFLPLYDPAPFVHRYGVERAIISNANNFTAEFAEVLADEYLRFMVQIAYI